MATIAATTKEVKFENAKAGSPNEVGNVEAPTKFQDLSSLLLNTKAGAIPHANRPVVEVQAHMTPLESAKVLWENKIIGAPVWDKDKQAYVGFFDMRDLLSTVLVTQTEEDSWLPEHLTTSYLAARNPFVDLYNLDSSLLEVCRALCQKDAHRVPLVDPKTKRCVRILTQSAIVKFLAQHVTQAQFPALHQTLGDAQFPYKKQVIQAVDTATAHQVFTLIDQYRLSGIAIVDQKTGKHVGNTSASDIKLAVRINEDQAETDMSMDILSYLSAVRQETPLVHDSYPCPHVRESSTVGHALKMLAKTGFHRVFVVDDNCRPVGVISASDIVQFVVSSAKNQGK